MATQRRVPKIRIAVAAAVALAAVGILVAYLFLELGESNDRLTATRATLADTQMTLQETDSALSEQTVQNTGLERANTALRAEKESVEATNALLEFSLDDALDAIEEWKTALQGSRSDYEDLSEEHAVLTVSAQGLRSENTGLQEENTALQVRHDEVVATHGRLEVLLEEESRLSQSILAIREEIAGALERRQALIVGVTADVEFACTGSMEPKITCLDTATWAEPIEPGEIVVGAVVTYAPPCWEDDDDDGQIAHRVTHIEVTNGIHYYWTKGDANTWSDGCWIPYRNVHKYMIDLHKNTRPENADLRNSVNHARAEYIIARNNLSNAMARNGNASLPEVELRCRDADDYNDCFWAEVGWGSRSASDIRAINRAIAKYNSSTDYYDCWIDNALARAVYPSIPLKLCFKAPV